MNVVAYTRVSTREQADTGHGIDAQRTELRRQAELRGWEIVAWCEDLGVSGKDMNRDQLAEAVRLVESGEADALVATKIDRVSRSVADFATLVCRANTRGWGAGGPRHRPGPHDPDGEVHRERPLRGGRA